MVETRPEDLLHKSQLNRLLIEIVDEPLLAQSLAFKGGTCAALLGYLDRFSVDLDFDVIGDDKLIELRPLFHQIIDKLGMSIMLKFDKVLFFQLRYPSKPRQRSTLKVSASDIVPKANRYKTEYFPEIDRLMSSQTIETMFGNKLVALTDRFKQHKTIAGRDMYDIHHFFIQGYTYNREVIQERTGLEPHEYFKELLEFIKSNVNQTIFNEDLNSLLPTRQFQQIRKILLPETIALLEKAIHQNLSTHNSTDQTK